MKAAMYYSQRDIRIEDLPAPQIKEDEVLVEMKACGICGSDLMDWYLKSRSPLVLGHEPAGVIAKKGRLVEEFDVGDRVFVHHHVACMVCHFCQKGDFTLCDQFHSTYIDPGGFAEFFRVPSLNLRFDTLRIPEEMSFEEATFIEPVGCCIRALKKAGLQIGDTVAVIGAGTTGLIHTALSKIYGASLTIVSDLIKSRLDIAKEFGADVVANPKEQDLEQIVDSQTDGLGVDVAVVTAPNLEAYRTALNVCRKGGRLCVFAPSDPSTSLAMSPKDMFFSEIQIVPSYSTSHVETRAALKYIEAGRVRVKDLITHRFDLEHVADGFATALNGEGSLKIMIVRR